MIDTIESIITTIDADYGNDIGIDQNNGVYIIVIQAEKDFQKLKEIYINIDDVIPEYVDRIKIKDEDDYIIVLILCNNDYAISLIMLLRIS